MSDVVSSLRKDMVRWVMVSGLLVQRRWVEWMCLVADRRRCRLILFLISL